jgi:hypothetical protein
MERAEYVIIGFSASLMIAVCFWGIYHLNQAQRAVIKENREREASEDRACVANGGFVFADSDGRKCLFKPGYHAN